jgi:phage virion morphogenesis protein
MTGVSIDVVLEADKAGLSLDQLDARLDHLDEPLMEFGEVLMTSTHDRFAAGGPAPDGTPWAPLAPRTLRRKRGPGILRESLHLMGSMRYQLDAGDLLFGTNVPYARIHQLGGQIKHKERQSTVYFHRQGDEVGNRFVTRKRSNFAQDVTIGAHETEMPARPYLGISHQDQGRFAEILQDYLAGN